MKFCLAILFLLPTLSPAATVTETQGEQQYKNYLAAPNDPKAPKRRPGVLLLPEWWGVTEFERGYADRLAKEGYVVLVVDLYGDGRSTSDPTQASRWMQAAEKDERSLNQRFQAAQDLLRSQTTVDPKKIAVIGFGFGGGLALDQARLGQPLRGVVNYYGGVSNGGRVLNQKIQAEILELVGSRDEYTPPGALEDLKHEMKSARAKLQVEVFKGAYQSFPNKLADAAGTKHHKPFQYDEAAATRAWQLTTTFLRQIFN